MPLDTNQQMLIEQRIANDAKSPLLAYLLLIFLGWLGVHRFYLGCTGTGVTMLILFVLGLLTAPIGVGFVLLLVLGIWCLVDLFLIPGITRADRDQLRQRMAGEMQIAAAPTSPPPATGA